MPWSMIALMMAAGGRLAHDGAGRDAAPQPRCTGYLVLPARGGEVAPVAPRLDLECGIVTVKLGDATCFDFTTRSPVISATCCVAAGELSGGMPKVRGDGRPQPARVPGVATRAERPTIAGRGVPSSSRVVRDSEVLVEGSSNCGARKRIAAAWRPRVMLGEATVW